MTQKLFTRKKLISLLVAVSLGMTTTETSVRADSLFSDVTQDSISTTHQSFFPKQIAQRNRTNYVFEQSIAVGTDGSNLLITPNRKRLMIYGRKAEIWNLETNRLEYELPISGSNLAISPNSKYLVDGGFFSQNIDIWNLDTGTLEKTIILNSGFGNYVVISPDGKYLIVQGNDNMIEVLEITTGQLKQTINDEDIQQITITFDG